MSEKMLFGYELGHKNISIHEIFRFVVDFLCFDVNILKVLAEIYWTVFIQ